MANSSSLSASFLGHFRAKSLESPNRFSLLKVLTCAAVIVVGAVGFSYWQMVRPTNAPAEQAAAVKNDEHQIARATINWFNDLENKNGASLVSGKQLYAALTKGPESYLPNPAAKSMAQGSFVDRWNRPFIISIDPKSGFVTVTSMGPNGKSPISAQEHIDPPPFLKL